MVLKFWRGFGARRKGKGVVGLYKETSRRGHTSSLSRSSQRQPQGKDAHAPLHHPATRTMLPRFNFYLTRKKSTQKTF